MDPKYGGTAEAVRMLLQYAPAGVITELITLDGPEDPFLRGLRGKVHALGPVGPTYGYSRQLLPWLEANRERFDGVVVHGLWQYCTRAVHTAMRGRVPYMVFPHGMLDPYFKRRFPLKHLKKWIYWLGFEYWVLRDADRVLFTTAAEQELAKQSFWLHRWRGETVPFGTVLPEGDPARQLEAFYAACPQACGRRVLLFLGRIHAKKGCDMLLDAFAEAGGRDPDLDLVMAGPDQQNSQVGLQQQVGAAGLERRVHWPGMLLGDAKWGAFRASEAFILPSHQENFGIAVAEALACGVPVLLSDKVNIAADIAADGAGLMEPDTAEGTVRLIARWLDMPGQQREAMRARAVQCFGRRYDMHEGAKAVVELFERVHARRS